MVNRNLLSYEPDTGVFWPSKLMQVQSFSHIKKLRNGTQAKKNTKENFWIGI